MDLLSEEQKIALIFQKNNNIVEMISTINKIYDDRLELILPQYFMRYVGFLQVGCKITAKAFSKLGTVDFNSIVISSPLEESFIIELDYNSIKLTPGKEMPSIKAMEQIEIFDSDKNVYNLKTFELTTDFVKFYSDRKFKLEDNISGTIKFPKDYGIIKFNGVITENDPIYDNEYTALFTTMTENDRQNLLYYMYMYTKDSD